MTDETVQLAEFAVGLRYEDIPEAVKQRARDSIADTFAAIVFGSGLPWSRIVIDYARQMGAGGKSMILGDGAAPVSAPFAALANGALAHAFELDGPTRPSSGVHPGAMLLSGGLAVAQDGGFDGKAFLTAFVTASEVMIRIARATKHSNEVRGFHGPGTTGPFGAAVAGGKMMGFDKARMVNALGIAGELPCGLVEFSRSGTGAMVKRLHFGRAAEGGVMAAYLAAKGFTGPHKILEGDCGFLKVYCDDYDVSQLTKNLGSEWLTSRIMMKRYACHSTGHTPVQAMLNLKAREGLKAAEVESITIEAGKKELGRHNIPEPEDVMIGQYSVPFCSALALLADASDPTVFRDADVKSPELRALMARITLVPHSAPPATPTSTTTIVKTKDGRTLKETVLECKGTPENPLSPAELREKFLLLTRERGAEKMGALFDRIQAIEGEKKLDWMSV